MIRLINLTKQYGRFTAVDGINLTVPEGELFGFLGPNGAGKTTTLRMIAGILKPTAGTVQIAGDDIQARPLHAKARLGFIPDRPYVYEKLTGAEFLRFVAALYGQGGPEVERRADELLDLFELTRWKHELVESYSHGMRQKLIISSALVHRPAVIVVDEPMVGLDPASARLLKDLFREFVSRGGTVLMSTHTMEVAEAMCDRIAIIKAGKIVAEGTMAELRQHTASGDMSLEDLFLKITGELTDRDVSTVLGPDLAMTDSPIAQPAIWTLLSPKWRSALTRGQQGRKGASGKVILISIVGVIFWIAIFGVLYKVLKYFKSIEEIGILVPGKLLGMALLAFLSVLLLSNLITSLSTFFLAKDLDLVVSAPVDWLRFYVSKLSETVLHSSWMVVLLAVPIFTAYGVVFGGGWLFPVIVVASLVPFLVIPAVIGTSLTLILVNIFPARRTRDLLSLVAIGAAGGVVLMLRIVRPERLARPEGFQSLVDFITELRTPTSPFLPSEWASNMVMNWLVKISDPLPIALLWTSAAAFVVLGALLHRQLFTTGFTKAQEGAEKFVRGASWQRIGARVLGRLSPSRREFLLKDLRVFFRDATQWSQLILLAVLVVVYLFNITALPLFTGEKVPFFLITLVVFLNLGLAGFVLAAIAGRFIFPSFSLEGKQMWLLRSSPLDLRALLWSKYWIGTLPLLILAFIITIVTNTMLKASGFMMGVSLVTIVLLTFSISALALAFGVLYPQFDTENAAQIPTSFGGLVFMMSAVSLLGVVIMIEARPVMAYLRMRQTGVAADLTGELVIAGILVFGICGAATIIPLRLALKRMEEMEF